MDFIQFKKSSTLKFRNTRSRSQKEKRIQRWVSVENALEILQKNIYSERVT